MRLRTPWLTAALGTAALGAAGAASAQIGIGISINIAPPVLPVYVQPPVPSPGYLWAPGYWAWSADGAYYYWVPGTWIQPPQEGLLWTPGYWGWSNGAYFWHEGYWGPTVGFYGGVNYGFGYGPGGYDGGRWDHGVFYYNAAVNRVPGGPGFAHVYRHPMPPGGPASRVSFNGGAGGLRARATETELRAEHQPHLMPIAAQRQLVTSASHNREMRADFNHGHPGVTATARPGAFAGAHGEAAHAPSRAPTAKEHPALRPETGGRAGGAPAREEHAPGGQHTAPAAAPGDHQQEHQQASHPGAARQQHAPSHPAATAHGGHAQHGAAPAHKDEQPH